MYRYVKTKKCRRFQGDKSGLYVGCSNTFQRNFLSLSGLHESRWGRHCPGNLISFATFQKTFVSSVRTQQCSSSSVTFADRCPHPAHLLQSETILPTMHCFDMNAFMNSMTLLLINFRYYEPLLPIICGVHFLLPLISMFSGAAIAVIILA
ncbi:hypothetical protein TNCV_4212891 [Trichonephila clavipes]|nr:hypothetical protein TNCV_4212891 [Trichonephila clavipes]